MAKRTALLDGDMLAFRIAAGGEVPIKWDEWLWTLHTDEVACQRYLDDQIEFILKETGCSEARFAVSGSHNFRRTIYPEYKANRAGTRKPMALKALLDYGIEKYNGFRKDELEADDVLGIWQTRSKPGTTVIVSGDKDMRTVPGLHYNPLKPKEGVVKVSQEEADLIWMRQVLTGDTVDNIPGCPTFGPKTAAKVLPEPDHLVDLWEVVVDCFIKKGLAPADALLNARLTRILQSSDFDFDVGEVILWEPPQ